ncbi:di-heme-cytochrome C peroxidase [Marinobacter sp. SS21]|uniref:di-heme-cytochrome C peroxidase n=1 Tax=Marinobacter sp. SS21 TaxID=2979460 RepID=UPI00232E30DD|nr:di-heme-cytochrome C peroxidase [Marinobacter sp. SS21]MDC0664117.1 di-heme-cytochrome C peroxidase [Marinobacter sp. SS21]
MASRSGRYLWVVAAGLVGLLVAAMVFLAGPGAGNEPDTEFRQLTQGWSDSVREQMHHLSFGSRMLPYDWLLHLERADGSGSVREPAFLAQLGFIPTQPSALNPDSLPVGFSRAVDGTGTAWAGFNCAACHTGAIRYRGEQVLIEGGPALIDFSRFEDAVIASLAATLADPARLERLALALEQDHPESLRLALQQRLDYLHQRRRMNQSATAYGHGRLDAFGQIFNTVAVELLNRPGNAHPADAPVSYPFLWGAPYLDLVQWNGSAPNQAPGPLIQNVTTALAVFGTANLSEPGALGGYTSSVDIPNLGTLQRHYNQLRAPGWPEDLLGALDPDKLTAGRTLYRDNCLACHALSDHQQPNQPAKVTLVPRTEVGTDPAMATNFLQARAQTGLLAGRKKLVLAGPAFGSEASTIELVVHAALGATLQHPLDALGASLEDFVRVYGATPSQAPDQYKARPLAGIWATAPFLHNGSVPTLYHLLLPPEQRPASFHVGSRELDPVKVGYVTEAGPASSHFDTRLPANSNQGHVYGTDLDESARWALVEYLKSL